MSKRRKRERKWRREGNNKLCYRSFNKKNYEINSTQIHAHNEYIIQVNTFEIKAILKHFWSIFNAHNQHIPLLSCHRIDLTTISHRVNRAKLLMA